MPKEPYIVYRDDKKYLKDIQIEISDYHVYIKQGEHTIFWPREESQNVMQDLNMFFDLVMLEDVNDCEIKE